MVMRNLLRILGLAVICVACTMLTGMGLQSEEALVIEGGTIIDVTGGAPRTDTTIIIRNGRIQEIGPRNQVRRPGGATVIDAKAKFIIPGLTDCHVHYYDYMPPLFLAHGATSVMLLGGPVDWERTVKEATIRGELRGPRIFHAGGHLGGNAAYLHSIPLSHREEAIDATRKLIEKGVDYMKIYTRATLDLAQVISDEAHKAGKRVVAHLGPHINAREAAIAGIDMLAHGSGIPQATFKDPVGDAPDSIVGPTSLMQRELFADLIDLLIKEDVYIEPDLIVITKGIHPLSAKFALENQILFSDVELRFVPENAIRRWFMSFSRRDQETKEILEKGYENLTLFYRQFVESGGKLMAGTDTSIFPPGISLHQELELLVHAGILSPLQAIASATQIPAEFLGRSEDLGTVEEGKLADLVILNSDPLEDIYNTRDIFEVIKEGKVIDRAYHRYFTNPVPRPFPEAGGEFETPHIESVTPDAISCAETNVLTIRGSGFARQSWARIDGVGYDINFVSSTEIRVEVNCQRFAFSGTHSLVLVNPKPIKGIQSDVSNEVRFVVLK